MSRELFSVDVNEEGTRIFRRLSTLSLIILVTTLLMGSLEAASVLSVLLKPLSFSTAANRFTYHFYLSVVNVVLGFLMQAVQIILYRRFIRLANASLQNSDSAGFNRSFRWLYLQAVWYLLQTGVTLLFMAARFLL